MWGYRLTLQHHCGLDMHFYLIHLRKSILLSSLRNKTMKKQSLKKIFVFMPAVAALFLFSIAGAQDIHPSAIIQIKKADPEMMKKLSLQATSNHENEFLEEFRNRTRQIKKSSINNFSNKSIPIDIGASAQTE